MKIGFIGVGVVGGAIREAVSRHFTTVMYDKFREGMQSSKAYLLDCDVIFVSVPTATDKLSWEQNQEPLIETCEFLKEHNFKGVVVNKCTVLPGTTRKLRQKYGLRLVHNPEFLTAAKPYEDFINQTAVLLSGTVDDCSVVIPIFNAVSPIADINYYDEYEVTELSKYTHNTFLATKVGFFNDIYVLCNALNVSYIDVMEGVHAVGQVGKQHTTVPGPDGSLGYGGMCFPKDTKALAKFCQDNKIEQPVLNAVIAANLSRRIDG